MFMHYFMSKGTEVQYLAEVKLAAFRWTLSNTLSDIC